MSSSGTTRAEGSALANQRGVPALERLARAARQMALYGPTHPMARTALEEACRDLAAEAEGEKVEIQAQDEGLVWNGKLLAGRDGNVARFLQAMHDRLIAAIEISRSVPPEELGKLLMLLAEDAKRLISQGGAWLAFSLEGLSSIRIEEVDFSSELLASEAAWLELCRAIASEQTGALGGIVASCVRSLKLFERSRTTPHSQELSLRAEEPRAEGQSEEEMVAARVAWLIQQAGETAYFADQRYWETWRKEVAEQLAVLSDEWRARVFRSSCRPSAGSADMLGLIAQDMAPEQCVSAVLDYPEAIRAERSEALARALRRIMSDPQRAESIAPLLHERAIALGVPEEVYQNVMELLVPEALAANLGPAPEKSENKPARPGTEREEAAPRPDGAAGVVRQEERFTDLLETTAEEAVRRSRLDMLLEALETELSPRQYGSVLSLLAKAAEECAEQGILPCLLAILGALQEEAGKETRRDTAPSGRGTAWRAMAANALARAGSERAVAYIRDGFEDADAPARQQMIGLLRSLGEAGRLALLKIALSEAYVEADQALRAFVESNGGESPYLHMLVSQAGPGTLPRVMRGLIEVEGRNISSALAVIADHAEEEVKLELVRLLRESGRGDLVEVLLTLLSDSSARVRMAAAGAAATLRADQGVPALCQLAHGESAFGRGARVKEAAVCALGAMRASAAVPTLREVLLGHGLLSLLASDRPRLAAAEALGEIGGPEAQRALEEGTRTLKRAVREASRRALARLASAEEEGPPEGDDVR